MDGLVNIFCYGVVARAGFKILKISVLDFFNPLTGGVKF